jgi:hypothetical protein
MSHKRVIIPAICILLAVAMLVLGCGNSEDEDILKGDFRIAMLRFYMTIAEHINIDLPPLLLMPHFTTFVGLTMIPKMNTTKP